VIVGLKWKSELGKRIEWIDQVKGLSIFLVVFGHNDPIANEYLYSFRMPLFFMIAGFFHSKTNNIFSIKKRAKSILVPYFLWSLFLFLFWWGIGRFYGESIKHNLSVFKNFIGIFYAQGGQEYMDWGIPMWFIPAIFLSFLFFYGIRLIKSIYLQTITLFTFIILGFLLPNIFQIHFIWSIDVALVSLVFYALGFYIKDALINLDKIKSWGLLLLFMLIHFSLFNLNSKVDMYRSIYGNEFLFILNGISGALFFILIIKNFPVFKFFGFMGKFTIPILALQLRAMTVIKFFLLIVFGLTVFNFSESEKFILSIIQVCLILPVAVLINKYIPILNGGYKKI
jgi:fucose 4-O-acetylase-like acetyltransferase